MTLHQTITKALKRAAVVAGLLAALMIYGHLTNNPNTVEWPTGQTERK